MSNEHQKLASLAERLEFCNALLKQAQRELARERMAHGMTRAALHEAEDARAQLAGKLNEADNRHKSLKALNAQMRSQLKHIRRAYKASISPSTPEALREETWLRLAMQIPDLKDDIQLP